eukprot:502474-Amorphochlora_amoeboformis.AAC.1
MNTFKDLSAISNQSLQNLQQISEKISEESLNHLEDIKPFATCLYRPQTEQQKESFSSFVPKIRVRNQIIQHVLALGPLTPPPSGAVMLGATSADL